MHKYAIGGYVFLTLITSLACAWLIFHPPITGETRDGRPYQLDDFLDGQTHPDLEGRTFLIEVEFLRRFGDEDNGAIICTSLPGCKDQGEVFFGTDYGYGNFSAWYDLDEGERIVLQARYRGPGPFSEFEQTIFVRRGQ